jgi:hypothetical protein
MASKKYSDAMCLAVVKYLENHTQKEASANFGIPMSTVPHLASRVGYVPNTYPKYVLSFKHEVCQYYEHHTGNEVTEKYGVRAPVVCGWRKDLGYRNKHRGFNMITAQVTPKAVNRNYRMVKNENGDLKALLMDLRGQIEDLKEQKREQSQRIDTFVQSVGRLLQ